MRPVGHYIILREESEAPASGGLILDGVDQRYRRGVVEGVGPDVPSFITQGSVVIFDHHRAVSIFLGGRGVTVVRSADIVLCDA